MAESPPKRITRSRAKAAEMPKPPSKPIKTTTPAPRATSAAKRRVVPAQKEEAAAMAKPPSRTSKTTPAAPRATSAAKRTVPEDKIGEAKMVKPPTRAIKTATTASRATSTARGKARANEKLDDATISKPPAKAVKMTTSAPRSTRSAANRQAVFDEKTGVAEAVKKTRGRPKNAADDTQPQTDGEAADKSKPAATSAVQPPKRPRGRPKKTEASEAPKTEAAPKPPSPAPAAVPAVRLMRGGLVNPSRGITLIKKKVTFADDVVDKENRIPPLAGMKRSADTTEDDAVKRPRGLNAKPIRRPTSTKYTTAKKPDTPEPPKEPETTEVQPLSPKKVQQNTVPDLSSPPKRPPPSPFKDALKESPKRINLSFLSPTISSAQRAVNKVTSPPKSILAAQSSVSTLMSPPKRAAQTPLPNINTPSQATEPTVNIVTSPLKTVSAVQHSVDSLTSPQKSAVQYSAKSLTSPLKIISAVQHSINSLTSPPKRGAQTPISINTSSPFSEPTLYSVTSPNSVVQRRVSSLTSPPKRPITNTDEICIDPVLLMISAQQQAASKTPTRPVFQEPLSAINTPMPTPRPDGYSQILKGAVVFVDVHTTEGQDASCLFIELLTQMGARCVRQWSWNPAHAGISNGNSADGHGGVQKIGITHVVFKDGGKRTLEKVRESNGVVLCVGVAWVLDCERQNTWLDESTYAVDTSLIPRGGQRRRKSMEPKALPSSTTTTPSTSSTASLARRFLNLDDSSPTLNFGTTTTKDAVPTPKTPHFPATTTYSDVSGVETEIATPYFLKPSRIIQQTCPPKPSHHIDFNATEAQHGPQRPLSFNNDNHGGADDGRVQRKRAFELSHDNNEVEHATKKPRLFTDVSQRLLAARRRSLMWAPKVGSPLRHFVSR